jgi:hypothetical protein
MESIKNKINEKTKQILQYTTIITTLKSDIYNLEKEIYLLCDHTFESELITSGPYREYEYVCSKCGYATKHIV